MIKFILATSLTQTVLKYFYFFVPSTDPVCFQKIAGFYYNCF